MFRKSLVGAFLALYIIAGQGQSVTIAIPTPTPGDVGVNSTTNQIYVARVLDNSVSVIDGARDKVRVIIPVGGRPGGVGVNPATNRIYVANSGARDHRLSQLSVANSNTVSVINGVRDEVVATIPVGNTPRGVGVNPTTNRIYVANLGSNTISVIDGAQDQVIATIGVEVGPWAVGVNPTTNRIYVANERAGSVSVIDGARNEVITTIRVGECPFGAGVNPTTNRIYVPYGCGTGYVSVIDGARNEVIAIIAVETSPRGVGVNPTTNRIYVANAGGNPGESVSVIDGAQDKVIATIPVGFSPMGVGVNLTTNRIYVGNVSSSNVSVLVGNDLLTNPSFDGDLNRDGLPDAWSSRNLEAGDGLDPSLPDVYEGKYSLNLRGSPGVKKKVRQRIEVAGRAGSFLNLEGFSKAENMTPRQGQYRVKVRIVYIDDTSDAFAINFGRSKRGTFGWRRETARFHIPKDYNDLIVSVIYEDQTGTVWFDALHLWPSE